MSNRSLRSIPSRMLLSSLLTVSLLAPAISHAQTADDVVNKYVDALGGKAKLQTIHTVYQEGVAVLQTGMEIDSRVWHVQGKLFRNEIAFGAMGSVTTIITPDKGWSSNPRNGGNFVELPADAVKAAQYQLDCTSPLVDYAAKGNKIELTGKDTVNGHECYRIKLTDAGGHDVTYHIDASSYYILRESRKGGGMMGGGGGGPKRNPDAEINIDYADYQKTADGYVFPFSITIGTANGGAKTSVEKLEVNKPVDEASLSKPK